MSESIVPSSLVGTVMYVTFVPGDDPAQSLADALAQFMPDPVRRLEAAAGIISSWPAEVLRRPEVTVIMKVSKT